MPTKKLVPRDNNEGGLGTAAKTWGASWLQNLVITNLQTTTSLSVLVETAGNVEKRSAGSLCTNVTDTESATTWVGLYEAATGCLMPFTDEQFRFDASTGKLYLGGTGALDSLIVWSQNIYSHADFVIESGNTSSITLSATEGTTFFTGIGGAATMKINGNGLFINNIPTEATPTHMLVDNTTTAGLVSKAAVGSLGINVADTEDTTCFVGLWEAATGTLLPKTDEQFRFDAQKGILYIGGTAPADSLLIQKQLIKAYADTIIEASNGSSITIDSTFGETYFYGGVFGLLGSISNTGLSISNIPVESSPVNILVDNVAAPGLVSKMPLSTLPTTLIKVLDTEVTTCFVGLWESATGNLAPKTDEGLTYNAQTGSEVLSIAGDILMGDGTHNDLATIDVKVGNAGIGGNRLVLNAGDSGAGTNLTCGNVQLTTGLGTGTGNNPIIDFVGTKQVASGTGQQATQTMAYFQHFGDGGASSYNHLRIVSPQDGNDLFDVATYADGATVIKTQDNAAAAAHLVLDSDGDTSFKKTGTTLATVESLRTESFLLAASDESTLLVAGLRKVRFRIPYAFTLTNVRLSCNEAPTGSDILTVDITKDGVSIFDDGTNNGVRPTIAASALTSVGGTAHVFATGGGAVTSTVAIADDSIIGVDLDVIGSTLAGRGLKVTLIGHKTV